MLEGRLEAGVLFTSSLSPFPPRPHFSPLAFFAFPNDQNAKLRWLNYYYHHHHHHHHYYYYLSDHSQIAAWINTSQQLKATYTIQGNEETQQLKSLLTQFLWSTDSSTLFKTALKSSNIQSLVDKLLNNSFEKSEVGIDQVTSEENTILLTASKQSLKRAIVRRRCRISNSVKKKWFDKDCRLKRHEVRKLANQKRRDPLNTEIRISYDDTLSEYKNLLRTKQQNYKNEKVRQLTESQDCSQSFWNIFKAFLKTYPLKLCHRLKRQSGYNALEIYIQPRKCKIKIKIQY